MNNESEIKPAAESVESTAAHVLDDDLKRELLELASKVANEFSNFDDDDEDTQQAPAEPAEHTESLDHETLSEHLIPSEEKLDEEREQIVDDCLAIDNHYESFKLTDTNNNKNDDPSEKENDPNGLFIDDDFKLPELDWENLEAKLKIAQQEVVNQNKRANLNNDREEIRRKLAIVSSSSSSSSLFNDPNYANGNETIISDYMRKPSINKPNHYLGQNLQICFMNEANNDEPLENETLEETLEDDYKINNYNLNSNETHHIDSNNKLPNSGSSFSVLSVSSNESCDNVLIQLQNDIKLALSRVPYEVKNTIQCEIKNSKKPSPIADIVGLPTYGLIPLEREHIVDMNIGQLQVIVNDLCNQIEKINEELKKLLIDRDDLYMQQDSLLVDIEDITRRIHEYSIRFKAETQANDDLLSKKNLLLANKMSQSTSTNALADRLNSLLSFSNVGSGSSSPNNINDKNNLISNKSVLNQLSSFTNKLYRFTKKS